MGRVAVSVADLSRSLAYYQEHIGLQVLEREGETAVLGVAQRPLLVLQEQPGARPSHRAAGLYHFAILLPSRLDLARTLYHFIQAQTPLVGASDHGVSEALYLTDPDGHGIEIYRDRPRAEWPYVGDDLRMVTEPFDAEGVLAELSPETAVWQPLPPGTTMGHVHLHVGHLAPAMAFYHDVLGFDVIMQMGESAGFLSFGGYHHHLGLNTWAGVGAPPAAPDKARLLWYEIMAPEETAVADLADRLTEKGVAFTQNGRALHLQDPSANHLVIQAS
ncbi:MAG: VOC family protein [Ardenticatenaceae bacterium]|nr:VOC family protein [Ardenticatenaceae bacterium]MCB8986144.1 VOC family protein [Ardenticatenaceae bacterium]